ncbi:MFS transporter [Chloroflexota bacterium]
MNSETQRGTSPTRGRNTTVALLIFCLSLQALGQGSLSLFLPVIKEDLSFSFTEAGTLAAAATLLYFLMQIPAGYLADRFGPKRLFFIGAFGTTALVLAFGFVSQYWQALANVTVSGFFRALQFAPGLALITGWFSSERRATAMAIYHVGLFVGHVVLTIGGPLLVEAYDWKVPFIAFGLAGVVVSFVYLQFGKESPDAGPQRKVNISDIFKLFRSRFMWLCGVIQFIRLAINRGITFWLPTFLMVDRGLTLQVTGFIILLRGMLGSPSVLAAGYISDKLKNPPLVIGFSLVMLAITTTLLAMVDNIVLLVVIIGVNALFVQCYFGPLFAMPLEVLGSHTRGTTTGVSNTFANLGSLTFAYILGAMRDASGSFELGFYTVAGLAVIGLVFTILVARERRKALALTA